MHKSEFTGGTVWITGLPAAGKTTLARALQQMLCRRGCACCLLDGDAIREGLSEDLGLSAEDRSEQSRRVAHVAALVARSHIIAVVALVSPYRSDRAQARALHTQLGLPFVETWLDTPLAICEQRDPKNLYARARARTLTGLTGVDAPYERPDRPEVQIAGNVASPETAAQCILEALPQRDSSGAKTKR